jgi:hypothetical protein
MFDNLKSKVGEFFNGAGEAAGKVGEVAGGAVTGAGAVFDGSAAGSYTKHEFEIQKEKLQGLIRGQKVRQFELKLDREKVVTRQHGVEVEIAQQGLKQTQYKLAGQQFNTEAERYHSQTAQQGQYIAQLGYQTARNQYEYGKIEANLQFQQMGQRLRAMNLDLGRQIQENDDLTKELNLQGVLRSTGENVSFKSLVDGRD